MDCITKNIAVNLRRIRISRHLSLDEVAEMTGVSKSMLGQIERGDANPTVGSLLKISGGLKMDLFELMSTEKVVAELVKREEQRIVKEEEGRYKVWCLYPFNKKRSYEVYVMELQPGVEYSGTYHGEHSHESLNVTSGELDVKAGGEEFSLSKGDAVEFEAGCEHTYINNSSQVVEAEMIISSWS